MEGDISKRKMFNIDIFSTEQHQAYTQNIIFNK